MPDRPLIIPTADERQAEERGAIRVEVNALAIAFDALQQLGEEARYRALIWLTGALDLPTPYRALRRAEQEVPF
jgi:hypothetical protein